MIRSIPFLMHNIINKNFERLALLYEIISQNLKIIPALFQLNQQVLLDYDDLTTL